MMLKFSASGIESAYRAGIFPMHNEFTGDIDWYRPDPRAIIPLNGYHVSRSLEKTIRQNRFEVSFNVDFAGVMRGCADRSEGTWISNEFMEVYGQLHRDGKAHSVEVWLNDRLVGGTYGVSIGGAFMGESMFHYETDASKVALSALVGRLQAREFVLLDTQFLTPHLIRMGAIEISNQEYLTRLRAAARLRCTFA